MTDVLATSKPGRGRISEGPSDSLAERTLQFVYGELATWRDDPERLKEEAEDQLNAQLCKYLNVAANHRFPMVHFGHEERQTGIRKVDISALPRTGQFVGHTYHTIYEPFLVFEGKRLPAPSHGRQREYVTGGVEKTGGIQRFKLALHGAKQRTAAIVAYVQGGSLEDWQLQINNWIAELAANSSDGEEKWLIEEQLIAFVKNDALHISSASSVHERRVTAISAEINLRHLWVLMQN